MDIRADGVVGRSGVATRERLGWLVGLCLLSGHEERILALLIGLGSGEPLVGCQRWWSTRALAAALAPELPAGGETIVAAALSPDAALSRWGLVRTDGERVTVNLRIARFLVG